MTWSRRTFLGSLAAVVASPSLAATPDENSIGEIIDQLQAETKAACPPEGGYRLSDILSALGAQAGFGCQMAIRYAIESGQIPAEGAFVEAQTKDGQIYYFGDQLNQPLLEATVSVWSLVAGAVQKAGGELPDIDDIVQFVAGSVGSSNFGTLRVSEAYQPKDKPFDALQRLWLQSDKIIKSMPHNPMYTGWYFALAAQRIILVEKDRLDPSIAGKIVMESAVSMAKIDPRRIGLKI